MDTENEISLDDLARESGVEARTIRGYVQRGLVPRPSKRGRGATYPPEALDRVRAIRRLMRDPGLGLDEIRRLFFRLDDEMIRRIADGVEPVVAMEVASASPAPEEFEALGSPIKACASPPDEPDDLPRLSFSWRSRALRSETLRDSVGGADSFDALLNALQSLTADRRVHPGSRAEEWIRVRVTPDLEIGVRGPLLGARGRAQLEEIADHLRELLMTRGGDPEA